MTEKQLDEAIRDYEEAKRTGNLALFMWAASVIPLLVAEIKVLRAQLYDAGLPDEPLGIPHQFGGIL